MSATFYNAPTGQATHQSQQVNPGTPYNYETYQSSTHQDGSYQQHQQQQQQQQQQQKQQPSLWNPAAAVLSAAASGNISDDTKMDMVASALKYSLDQGTAHFIPGLGRMMSTLRVYFAVDNNYVLRKIQRVSFPFFFKKWKRLEIESNMNPNNTSPAAPNNDVSLPKFALPIHDENAPDLYLPSMSLVTYVLLCALCYGTSGKFNPEIIPDVTTKCLFTQLLEVFAIRFGFYMMHVPVSFFDLCSFTGYKYFGLCFNMLIGLLAGWKALYSALIYTAVSAAYFLLKNISNAVPKHTAQNGPKRDVVVLGCAASQLATMWFLSQTKFLS